MIGVLLAFLAFTYDEGVAEKLTNLTRASHWTAAGAVPVGFDTYHPQGMVRILDSYFVSSVDKEGKRGHLFKIDASGKLLAYLKLTEGDLYHPGGIDYDGHDIWVPLAEYRPDSRSIIYKVNPDTMKATEVLRVPDHIGAVVHDPDDHVLYGMSWGSRKIYRWKRDGIGAVTHSLNPSHYVDYQDCKYLGAHRAVCGGVTEIRPAPSGPSFRLGGLDLIDLREGRPIHQVPVLLWTPAGVVMTQNPIWIEAKGDGLRAYFMPEDNRSTIYMYDVARQP